MVEPLVSKEPRLTMVSKTILLLACILTISSTGNLYLASASMNKHAFHQRITPMIYPPYGYLTPTGKNGTFEWSGVAAKAFMFIAEATNMTFSIIPPAPEQIKKVGIIKAAVDQLVRHDVDICAYSIGPNPELMKYIDFSYPVNFEPWKFFVEKPGEESRLFAFIRPFQPMVWYAFFLSLVGIVIMMAAFSQFYNRSGEGGQTEIEGFIEVDANSGKPVVKEFTGLVSDYFMYLLSVVTNQGSHMIVARNSFRILLGFFLLIATVLVNSYAGVLASTLTVPRNKHAVSTFDELVQSQEISVSVNPDSPIGQKILSAESGVYKGLGDQLRKHPENMYRMQLNASFFPIGFQRAYPVPESWTYYIVGELYKQEKYCRLAISDPLPYFNMFYWGLTKGGHYNQMMNYALLKMWESGLMEYWMKNLASPEAKKCLNKDINSAKAKAIKLVDLSSAFFILGVGTGLSVVCFLIEVLFRSGSKIKRNRNMKRHQVDVSSRDTPARTGTIF